MSGARSAARLGPALLVLTLSLAGPRIARATDIFSLHLDAAAFALEPDSVLASAGAGVSFELLLSGAGLRLGAVTSPLLDTSRGSPLYAWTLGPELAFFIGSDAERTHYMLSAQLLFALARVERSGHGAVEGVRVGPEFELRDVPGGVRSRVGLLYAPTRLPDGRWSWGGVGLRWSFELGKPAEGVVEPEGEERCPDGRARLVGTGCD